MQATQWYQYEENYRKYGFDMQPHQVVTKRKQHQSSALKAKERKGLLMLTVLLGVIGICIIVLTAFSATLQYQINQITVENRQISKDIDDVNIKLQTANSVTALQKKAKKELGMSYPEAAQIVYVNDITAPKDFAATVKEESYY